MTTYQVMTMGNHLQVMNDKLEITLKIGDRRLSYAQYEIENGMIDYETAVDWINEFLQETEINF